MIPRSLIPAMVGALLSTSLFAQEPDLYDPEFPPQPPIPALSPEEQAKTFQLPHGYRMEVVLSEPDIQEPTISTFDSDGRLYVAEMRTYMQDADGTGEMEPTSRVSLHWSSKGDGVFDQHTVFADHLLLPRMIQPLEKGRVIIGETNTNDLYLYTDVDGDGVSDKKELWYKGGPRGGNLEHQPNGLLWAIDNAMYSTYNAYRLRWTPQGPVKEPTAPNGGQWGLAQDDVGRIFFMNAGGERGPQSFQVPIVYGQFNPDGQMAAGFQEVFPLPGKADVQGGQSRFRPEDGTLNHFTATCGAEVYRGDRLPAELRGNLFFAEPVGRLIRRAVVHDRNGFLTLSNPYQEQRSEFIRSSDPLFRPVNFTNAPDGTLYITDMYRGIIQEGQWVKPGSYLRKKVEQYALDQHTSRGRIWRLVHESTQLAPVPQMSQETSAELVSHLESANGWIRDNAQKLLVLSQDRSVLPALQAMARTSADPLARLHALWTLDGLGATEPELLLAKMQDEDPRLRSAALRISEPLIKAGNKQLQAKIDELGQDEAPQVMMQSMLTARLLNLPGIKERVNNLACNCQVEGVRVIADCIVHPPATTDMSKFTVEQKKSFLAGQEIYQTLCATCHAPDGKGLPMVGGLPGVRLAPSLAGSKTINGLRQGGILVLLHGLIGEIEGRKYEGQMVSMASFDDAWMANVLSYVRNSFGNQGGFVHPEEIAAWRKALASRLEPWTEAELRASLPQPMRDRSGWRLSASTNASKLSRVVDGDSESRWDSGAFQEAGMWFQVELPEPSEIAGLMLEFGNSSSDYPRAYIVQLSEDGETWTAPVVTSTGTKSRTSVEFPPALAKFIRMTLTASVPGTVWSIHELQVLTKGRILQPALSLR